jgi:hypothetical protein
MTKQEAVDKILSFNYEELSNWIYWRLCGSDKYFPVYEGHEPNLSEFLIDAFKYIKNEKFRDNFLEVLSELVGQLGQFTNHQIEASKEYISELLFLCGNIKQFEEKHILLEIATKGRLKGYMVGESDLHAELLTTLASYRIAGTCEFWIDQLLDDSNKRYANSAFYALKDYSDTLFEYMGIFIDKFKGEVELVLGIMSLVNELGLNETVKRFRRIESQLSFKQKEAVNHAFEELKYRKPYKISPEPDKESIYKTVKPALSMVGEKKVEYQTAKTLIQKAGVIFEQMGFEVEFNCQMAGHSIDIFIKKKKIFGNKYECYICQCCEEKRKVNKDEVNHFRAVREAVEGCDAIIISEKGFKKNAVEIAGEHGIELKTLENLESDLRNFNSHVEKLIQKMR